MAAPDVRFRVDGLRDLERNLSDLADQYGPRNAIFALRAPMQAVLRPLLADIQARTPVDTGELRESARVQIRMPSRSRDRGPHTNFNRNVLVGLVGWRWSSGRNLWNRALAIEFGNRFTEAQPVLRPALESMGQTIADNFAEDLANSIERTASRLGRRQAAGRLNRR